MFYWFYKFLDINILQYISVRAGFAFFIGFLFTMYFMPKFIKWAKKRKASQPIYEFAPDTHRIKVGTPTMGGVVFIAGTLIATILTAKLNNPYVVGALIAIGAFCAIGIKDDIAKITANKNDSGLTPRAKMLLQIVASFAVVGVLLYANHSTALYIPFYKLPIFDMGLYAIVFWIFVMVATTNAVNLTDGLDGLATVPSIIAFFSLSVIVYITGHLVFSGYLLMPHIALVGELSVVGAAFIGSLIAFLWFNSHPAQVFMGDSGSLAIGGFMGYLAIVGKSEVLLIVIGLIFVIEAFSVILQVGSYKYRQKRVFLMAPIHHHFEKKGWHENKIIIRFWIIAFMANLLAILSLKIR
ncbi:MAG: phospho-N-acetylmuramoyl-pentapeptide-transferase [Arcobacteraceae bacterium]